MIKLIDGRDSLWQYDTGRRVAVDEKCATIHFSNVQFGGAYVVDVVDGEAAIPDEVLKNAGTLYCWTFSGTAEEGYTKTEQLFNVQRRAKPSDYTFTPTEQHSIGQVLGMIGSLEDLETDDKSDIVAAINEVNEIANEKQTANHEDLNGRDEPDQHPIEAISGLGEALGGKIDRDSIVSKASAVHIGCVESVDTDSMEVAIGGDISTGYSGEGGFRTVAIGYDIREAAPSTINIGHDNTGGEINIGHDNTGGFSSMLFGEGLSCFGNKKALIIGRYNEIDTENVLSFTLADGEYDMPRNDMTITRDTGNVNFRGNVYVETNDGSGERLAKVSELGSCAFAEKDDIVDEIMAKFVNAAEVAM